MNVPGGEFLERLAECASAHDSRFNAGWLLTGEGEPYPAQRPTSPEGQAALRETLTGTLATATAALNALAAGVPLLDELPDMAEYDAAQARLATALDDRTKKMQPPDRPAAGGATKKEKP